MAALSAGLALRAFFVATHARFTGDALLYADLAHNMVHHHIFGFSDAPIHPTLIRLPGYPLFLALCFALFGANNLLAVLWVQVAVDLAGCVLLSMLARRLAGERAGKAALWLAVLCPFTANYSAAVLTETLVLFCLILSYVALERWAEALEGSAAESASAPVAQSRVAQSRVAQSRAALLGWPVLLGGALVFSVLLRPDQGLLAAAVLPAMLWMALKRGGLSWTRTLMPVVVTSAVLALPLLLWGLRNYRDFHIFQPLAPRYANDPGETVPFGFQRWYRTWAADYQETVNIYWNYDADSIKITDLPRRAFDSPQQLDQTRKLFAEYNEEDSATPAFDQTFAALAAQRIAAHPLRYYLIMPLARELDMWFRPRTELMKMPIDWWNVRAHPGKSLAEIAYAVLNLAYLGAALVGLRRWRAAGWSGRPAIAGALLGFVVLRCLLLLTLDNSEPRYTLECFPIVILLASFALAPVRAASD